MEQEIKKPVVDAEFGSLAEAQALLEEQNYTLNPIASTKCDGDTFWVYEKLVARDEVTVLDPDTFCPMQIYGVLTKEKVDLLDGCRVTARGRPAVLEKDDAWHFVVTHEVQRDGRWSPGDINAGAIFLTNGKTEPVLHATTVEEFATQTGPLMPGVLDAVASVERHAPDEYAGAMKILEDLGFDSEFPTDEHHQPFTKRIVFPKWKMFSEDLRPIEVDNVRVELSVVVDRRDLYLTSGGVRVIGDGAWHTARYLDGDKETTEMQL